MAYKANLTYIVSEGWVDYTNEERDILDSYELTQDTEIAEAVGATPEEAIRNLLRLPVIADGGSIAGDWIFSAPACLFTHKLTKDTRNQIFLSEVDPSFDFWEDDTQKVDNILNLLAGAA